MQFYWELIQFDGTRLEVEPGAVETIRKRWDAGQPIHTKFSGSIPANQIKTFRPTDKVYTTQPLLEEVAQAFHEPMVTDEGVKCRWVKKAVTQERWNKYYSALPYKKLRDENGMVLIAMCIPVHQINQLNTPHCTDEEVRQLTTNP